MSHRSKRLTGPITRLREWIAEIRALPPGSRFVTLHQRHTDGDHSLAWRILGVVAGVGLILFGIVELVIPGPGLLFIALGGALLGCEFHFIAVALDSAEVKLRAGLKRMKSAWQHASTAAKAAVVGFAAAGVGAAAWLFVLLVRPGG